MDRNTYYQLEYKTFKAPIHYLHISWTTHFYCKTEFSHPIFINILIEIIKLVQIYTLRVIIEKKKIISFNKYNKQANNIIHNKHFNFNLLVI